PELERGLKPATTFSLKHFRALCSRGLLARVPKLEIKPQDCLEPALPRLIHDRPERRGTRSIDVYIRSSRERVVHDVVGIDPELHCLRFADPHRFAQIPVNARN